MTNKKAIAEKLLQINAIKLSIDKPFSWASGWKSPIYCDNRNIYVRPKPKEHGLGNQIEGFYEAGKRVVVVEDLISTGKSSLQVVDVLKSTGLEVEGMVSIFNYGFPVALQSFENYKLPLESLTDYESLIDLAIEQGLINYYCCTKQVGSESCNLNSRSSG